MRTKRRALTLVEAVVMVLLILILLVVVPPLLIRARERILTRNCKSELRSISVSMVTYVDSFGDGRYYPWRKEGGVATLSLIYSPPCRLLNDPRGWICPSTHDPLTTATTLSQATCSYIGRMPSWGVLRDSAASDTRVAGDDSIDHHRDGCNVLFLDGHVEFITASGNPLGPPLSATKE